MLLWTIIKVSLRSLFANKLRSFLSMLGIIIGVGAVIAMLALATGTEQQIMSRITAMGTNLLIVRPGGERRGGVRAGGGDSLKLTDAAAIVAEVEGVELVAPVVMGAAQVKYYNENTRTSVTGVPVTYLSIRNFTVESGRAFTTVEEERSSRVCVLGSATAETLFGDRDPVGERIRIKNVNFRVIGVLESKGDQGWFNPDDMVLVPYSTAMKQILGQEYLNEIDIQVADGVDLMKVEADVTALLRKRHRLRSDADDDFRVRNQAEFLEMASDFTRTFTILAGGIGSISLLVGGIGIMNIMLVTVTERTREIGIRKAIGARDRDILRQFMLESVLISAVGGILGIAFGAGMAQLVEMITPMPTVISTNSVLIALAVSCSVGIFFGYYPARRAARLDPIDSLRYE
jgi:putative ABC transport system permease protein